MNVTDIDDKIIKRARQNHLYDNYVNEKHGLDRILNDAKEVMKTFEDTVEKTKDSDKKGMYEKMLNRVKESIEKLEVAVKSNNEAQIKECQEVMYLFLLQIILHG